ncbi:hypothetical protein UPYG_G00067990 [Umbra pygmaea]|uniref:ShKT domain-containing protein n=1 Tax=Umbra pygmaea TaxID=75934 RepID=A0ABD0XSN0_UMBPY
MIVMIVVPAGLWLFQLCPEPPARRSANLHSAAQDLAYIIYLATSLSSNSLCEDWVPCEKNWQLGDMRLGESCERPSPSHICPGSCGAANNAGLVKVDKNQLRGKKN